MMDKRKYSKNSHVLIPQLKILYNRKMLSWSFFYLTWHTFIWKLILRSSNNHISFWLKSSPVHFSPPEKSDVLENVVLIEQMNLSKGAFFWKNPRLQPILLLQNRNIATFSKKFDNSDNDDNSFVRWHLLWWLFCQMAKVQGTKVSMSPIQFYVW